jgi:hypothetical protein
VEIETGVGLALMSGALAILASVKLFRAGV